MSTSTANWFLPTSTWKRRTQDYALVSYRAAPIEREICMHDRLPNIHYFSFQDYADRWYENRYRFLPCGYSTLVYADVDQKSPAHKDLIKKWAEQAESEVEEASVVEEKKKLIDAARAKFGFLSDAERDPEARSSTDPTDTDTDDHHRHTWPDSAILSELRHQVSDENSWVLKYIMKLPSRSAKSTVLRILSEQTRTAIVRPVMLLLDMLDSRQSTHAGETVGWATGYDFLDDVVVIKPFASREGHHPLGEPWVGPVVDDGVAFRGSPLELLTLVADEETGFGRKSDKNYHFSRIVRMEAASWVLEYRKALGVSPEASVELERNYYDREDRSREGFLTAGFPNKVKVGGVEEEGDEVEGGVKMLWEAMLGGLETAEVEFRNAAVGAKEVGMVKVVRIWCGFMRRVWWS